jgi:hypothetical protein
MFPLGAFAAKSKRPGLCGSKAALDAITGLSHADPAKALVMACISELAADGHAEWNMLDSGDIHLSFNTGGTFLLADTVIIRLA